MDRMATAEHDSRNLPAPSEPVMVAVNPVIGALRAYPALTRLYTVAPLALLSYGIGIATGTPTSHALGASLAIACALGAGYAYNDLRDQASDRVNRPRRPLVRGLVTPRHVGRLLAVLSGLAVLLAITTRSLPTIVFIILLIACSFAYSARIKNVTGLKNAFVGLWCGILPWGAALERASIETMVAAALIVALFVTQKEMAADVYDREGDAAGGVATIPVAFGPRAALALVTALNVASLLLARSSGPAPLLAPLSLAGAVVASINIVSASAVFAKITPSTVRAYLELQKIFQIGGCIALFAFMIA